MEPLWECRDLVCGYGAAPVLRGVSLAVAPGEFVGVIGPNGSGKTTLVRAAIGLLDPDGGEVRFDGRPVRTYTRQELSRRIGVVPQRFAPQFSFTVEEFVSLGRFSRGEDPPAIARVLAETGLESFADRPVTELSGGETQRALVAQTLAQEPELLFLDEPTMFLDIGHQAEIMGLVTRLNRERRMTVVMIQHDLNLAASRCDRLVLIHEGRVRIDATPEQVLDHRLIEEVYRTVVVVRPDPVTGRPHVYGVPDGRPVVPCPGDRAHRD